MLDDSTAGQTYELYGPQKMSMADLAAVVDKEIIQRRRHINLPKSVMKPLAEVLNRVLWWQSLTPDMVEREFIDQKIDRKAKTFSDLNIKASRVQDHTYDILVSEYFGTRSVIMS